MRTLLALTLLVLPAVANAEIAVSVNDGKQLRAGEPAEHRTADKLVVLDLEKGRVKPVGSVVVPASMIGPPLSVVLSPNGRYAYLTAAQRLEGTPPALVPDDSVSVVDLARPTAPKLLQTVKAGKSVSGIAVNATGTLVLTANAADDSISVFAASGGTLTPRGTVQLPAKSRPVGVKFLPGGRRAIVVAQTSGKLIPLSVDGDRVAVAGDGLSVGAGPYSIAVSSDGRAAFITNLNGPALPPGSPPPAPGARRVGTIASIDLTSWSVAQSVEAGTTPEHVLLSPSGKYLQVTLIAGSNGELDSPNYRPTGVMKVYAIDGTTITPLAETVTGGWCQGAAWSGDEKQILLQCVEKKQIEVYAFDGRTLTPQPARTLTFDGRPGAMATRTSR